MATFIIHTHSMSRLEERLAGLNKRLAKHGLPPATVLSAVAEVVTDSRLDPREVALDLSAEDAFWAQVRGAVTATVREIVYRVEVEAPTELIQWPGHTLLGRVERLPGGDLIHRLGDHDVDLEQFRGQPFRCGHCGKIRSRKAVWIYRRDDTGALLQLGDSCARDYFGLDVEALLYCALPLMRGEAEDEEWGFGGASRDESRRAMTFIAFAASLVVFEGYRSRKAWDAECTADVASGLTYMLEERGWDGLSSRLSSAWAKSSRQWWAATAPRWEEFQAWAAEAVAWWHRADLPETASSLDHNIQAVFRSDLDLNHAGLLAYGLLLWMRDAGHAPDPDRIERLQWTDEHLGKVGDRLRGLPVEFWAVHHAETDFGMLHILTFRDAAGRALVWKTGTESGDEWIQGQQLFLTGTIKAHSRFRERAQTVLTRCSLAEAPCPVAV